MKISSNVKLKPFTNYRIGGPARFFVSPQTEAELVDVSYLIKSQSIKKFFILGGGTNLLFSDFGFSGLVIKPKLTGIALRRLGDNYLLSVGANESVVSVLDFCFSHSLSGLEWAGGLPGEIGGGVRGNAGAFGGEMKDNIILVRTFNLKNRVFKEYSNFDCNFSYRSSIFKTNRAKRSEIITTVTFNLIKGKKTDIKKAIASKIAYRHDHQPLEYFNAGSVFENIPIATAPPSTINFAKSQIKTDPFPVIPAAYLLSAADLKGLKSGGAMISPKHPNFIINYTGRATSHDIIKLINLARRRVKQKFGVILKPEITIVK